MYGLSVTLTQSIRRMANSFLVGVEIYAFDVRSNRRARMLYRRG